MILIYLHLHTFKMKDTVQFHTIQYQSRTGVEEYELRPAERKTNKMILNSNYGTLVIFSETGIQNGSNVHKTHTEQLNCIPSWNQNIQTSKNKM